jgi:apolipoprotein N-acyltransferase
VFYDSYNTALLINSNGISIYHKSKLVPGVEQMPFPWLFKHIESLAIDLGGATGTLGKQDDRSVFASAGEAGKVAPAICYESIYGDFMQEYIRRGAGFIAVITNDGWWGDTPGYKQHLAFARLRAIESRRDVVRAANTGISAVINQRGDIIDSRPYWVPASIKAEVNLNSKLTLFSLTGDFIGQVSAWMSLFLIIYIRILIPFSARSRKKNLS